MELEFLGNEIVFFPPSDTDKGFDTGEKKVLQSKVLYTGNTCKLGYKEGDTVLYEDTPMIAKKTILDQEYWIISELGIICRTKNK